MYRLSLVIILLLGFCTTAVAQEETQINTNFVDKESKDRILIELFHASWLNKPEGVKTKWHSRGINLYWMYDFSIGESKYVSFAAGAGFSSHNIYTDFEMVSDSSNVISFTEFADDTNAKYKVSTNFLEVPLELRLKTKPNKVGKSFKVALGMRVGYKINGHSKFKGDVINEFGQRETIKVKDMRITELSEWRFGPSFRLGYGDISLVSFWSMNGLFKKNSGPDIHPFSIGITFNSF